MILIFFIFLSRAEIHLVKGNVKTSRRHTSLDNRLTNNLKKASQTQPAKRSNSRCMAAKPYAPQPPQSHSEIFQHQIAPPPPPPPPPAPPVPPHLITSKQAPSFHQTGPPPLPLPPSSSPFQSDYRKQQQLQADSKSSLPPTPVSLSGSSTFAAKSQTLAVSAKHPTSHSFPTPQTNNGSVAKRLGASLTPTTAVRSLASPAASSSIENKTSTPGSIGKNLAKSGRLDECLLRETASVAAAAAAAVNNRQQQQHLGRMCHSDNETSKAEENGDFITDPDELIRNNKFRLLETLYYSNSQALSAENRRRIFDAIQQRHQQLKQVDRQEKQCELNSPIKKINSVNDGLLQEPSPKSNILYSQVKKSTKVEDNRQNTHESRRRNFLSASLGSSIPPRPVSLQTLQRRQSSPPKQLDQQARLNRDDSSELFTNINGSVRNLVQSYEGIMYKEKVTF
jgi:hypothetical protein